MSHLASYTGNGATAVSYGNVSAVGFLRWTGDEDYDGKQGYGKAYWGYPDEDRLEFDGEYRDDEKYYGKFTQLSDKTSWEGYYADGEPDGEGTLTTYRNGKKVVITGVASDMDGRNWWEFTGTGIETYEDGTMFEGEFVDGEWTEGTLTCTNGEVYTGTWEEKQLEGEGLWLSESGISYSGNFRQSIPDGKGVLNFPSGSTFVGEYRKGVVHGQGVWEGSDGTSYQGEYANGKAHGHGIRINESGDKQVGQFKEGHFIA